jgi:hypothetical protein
MDHENPEIERLVTEEQLRGYKNYLGEQIMN